MELFCYRIRLKYFLLVYKGRLKKCTILVQYFVCKTTLRNYNIIVYLLSTVNLGTILNNNNLIIRNIMT